MRRNLAIPFSKYDLECRIGMGDHFHHCFNFIMARRGWQGEKIPAPLLDLIRLFYCC